ncbi:MAG: VanW family protein [Candidatus Margulisbacteria bacterium]|nr:VanW family protein [Candidatus Margulisiibacteriota bacterium]
MSNFPDLDNDYQEEGSDFAPFSYLNKLMKNIMRIIGVVAVSSALVAMSFISYDYLKTREAFPARTFIGNVDVSELNQDEAAAKLKSFPIREVFASLITLESDTTYYAFTPTALGIRIVYDETVRKAFELTHRDGYLAELKDRITEGASIAPLVLAVDKGQLRTILEGLAPEISSTPRDASMLYYEETGGYHIESEIPGRELNISKSIASFEACLYAGKRRIPLVIDFARPKVTEKALRANPPISRLSAYTTYYGTHDSPNRIHNIKLVASWINGTLLMPGEEFSVAEIIGDVSPEKGFKEAFVIVSGELVPLLGGGSCQIATTLYNTVQLADLKVLQRRNHSFYFNIYPLGRDAGVYPGQLDFRFKNDSGYPVLIKSVATNKRLSFRIYGTPSGKTVKFSGVSIVGRNAAGAFVPMSLRQVINLDVPFKTAVTRTVYDQEGKVLKEEVIGSYYKLYGEKSNVPIRRPEPR